MERTGIVLAGGKSSRMGTNKALLPIGNELLIQRIIRLLSMTCSSCFVVTSDPLQYSMLQGVQFVSDRYLNCGPLGGIEAGLSAAKTKLAAVVACDMPMISIDLLETCFTGMDESTDVVLAPGQPLHAVYRTDRCLAQARFCLTNGQLSLRAFLDRLRRKEVAWEQESFVNLNTPSEYQNFLTGRQGL